VQKAREAERAQVVDAYRDRVGTLVSGVGKRVDRNGIYIDLGSNAEGFVPRTDMIPREQAKPQDRIKAYLKEVRSEPRGPQLFLTRTAPEFLIELFKLEVPEVGQGLIQILGAARDAGVRAKIAVRSNDPRIDPVGACVGMRGSRVQAVVGELQGEKIDIIPWTADPANFVVNALAPAEVAKVVLDEDRQRMEVVVPDQQLSLALGRLGDRSRAVAVVVRLNRDDPRARHHDEPVGAVRSAGAVEALVLAGRVGDVLEVLVVRQRHVPERPLGRFAGGLVVDAAGDDHAAGQLEVGGLGGEAGVNAPGHGEDDADQRARQHRESDQRRRAPIANTRGKRPLPRAQK